MYFPYLNKENSLFFDIMVYNCYNRSVTFDYYSVEIRIIAHV